MPDAAPTITLPQRNARGLIRDSFLSDLDARIAAKGQLADYLYTTPRPELESMLRRARILAEDARALPGDSVAAVADSERILAATHALETELHCRDLVAQNPLNDHADLAYDLPDEIHAITQNDLAARLAYHAEKYDQPDYSPGDGFDHAQAGSGILRHLVAQQLDAWDRGIEVVPSEQTTFLLGEQIHERLTRSLMMADRTPDPAYARALVRGRIASHDDFLRESVEEFREYREYVETQTGQRVYPRYLPEHLRADYDAASAVVDAASDRAAGRSPRQLRAREATPAPEAGFLSEVMRPVDTPARQAYLDARAQAGAVGMALADPRMQRALDLVQLRDEHDYFAASLPDGYDATRKPPVWRFRERAEWQAYQPTARTLGAIEAREDELRTELGPDSDKLVRRAVDLVETREQILSETSELQRNAVEEEIARQPEWLTKTLGPRPRPELARARWHTLAGQLAANRLRFAVADDADPGVRPDQSLLADKVASFRAEAGLEQAVVSLKPALGLGM